MLTTLGASVRPYVPMTGTPNLVRKRSRNASGSAEPPDQHSRRVASAFGAIPSSVTRLCSSAGGPFQTVTASRSIQSATPLAYIWSMITAVPPADAVVSVVSTCMLRIVNGRQSPLRSSGPHPRLAPSTAPGRSRLRWECTAPFGRPVVPLV